MLKNIGHQVFFQCTICQKSFSAKGSLDYHSRVKHAISEDIAFRCKKCNVSFSDMKALQKHKKTHVKNVKIECHMCGLMLEKKSLAGHIVEVHNIEFRYDADKRNFPVFPYQCTDCDFVCKRRNDLDRHHRAKHTLGVVARNKVKICCFFKSWKSVQNSINFCNSSNLQVVEKMT